MNRLLLVPFLIYGLAGGTLATAADLSLVYSHENTTRLRVDLPAPNPNSKKTPLRADLPAPNPNSKKTP